MRRNNFATASKAKRKTNNPKKHIIDSLLREIYGEKSPPDQTDAILRRLESGDSTLLTESDSNSYTSDSGTYPSIRSDSESSTSSLATNWIAIAATVVFCVGLIGAMTKVLIQTDDNQVADNSSGDDSNSSGSLKHSDSLAVKEDTGNPNSNGKTELADSKSNSKNSGGDSTKKPLIDVDDLSPNPLPTYAENAKRIDTLQVTSLIDQSLSESWHVHVIDNPDSIRQSQWIERVFEKSLGRKPEADELVGLQNYLNKDDLPSSENQLKIVEAIIFGESTSREFSNYWADRF